MGVNRTVVISNTPDVSNGTEATEARSSAPAVVRSAALLSILAEAGSEAIGTSELARRLDLPKSSVANLLSALEQVGFVRREGGRYELGFRLFELGTAYANRIDIIQEFKQASGDLRWASQETIQLAMLDGAEVAYLARHDGTQPIRMVVGLGSRMPASCTALGKALLSELDPVEVHARMGTLPVFPVLTPKSKRNMAELMEDLDGVRERGYAIDDEENSVGIVCYAIPLPVIGPNGPMRAISVTLIKARETPELRERLLDDLRQLRTILSLHR